MDKKENTETTAGSLVPFPPGKIIVPSQFEGSSFVEGTGTSGVTPMFYWRALVRNKWHVVLGTLAGIAVAVLFLILVKPVYRAKSTIEVLSMNQDFMNMKQTDPVMAPPFSDEVSEEQTQSQLFFSEALLARVRNKFDPNRPAVPFHPPQSTWQTFLGTSNKPPLTPREKLLDAAVKSMNVVVLPRTRLLEVSADSKDPQFAADFVKTLVDQFVRGNVEAHLNTTQNTSNWLSGELNDARSNLQHSEDALQAYARSSGLLFTDSGSQQQTTVVSEKLQGIERSLSAATADRIAKQSRYEVAAHSPADSLADVLNDLGLQALKQKIDDAGRQVAQLNAIYNADYSKVKRAKAELAALQNAFQTARASIISRIKIDYN